MARSGTPPPKDRYPGGGGGNADANIKSDGRKGRPAANETLFQRMGGINAVKAVVDEFYGRIQQDERVQAFFVAISMAHLKRHQVEFLKIAFSHAPDGLDVHNLLLEKHKRLFATAGLNETHFDVVVGHFLAACAFHNVSQGLMDEATAIIAPLRVVFAEGAKTHGPRPPPEQAPPPASSSLSPTRSPSRSPLRQRLAVAMSILGNINITKEAEPSRFDIITKEEPSRLEI
jgi:hemoglobin